MSRKGEAGRKWSEEQRLAASKRAKVMWTGSPYREKQVSKLLVNQKKAALQRKIDSRVRPIESNTSNVRHQRLIEECGNRCQVCGQGPEWNNKPLRLQVHDHRTSRPELLCPNCHSQTDSFCGRAHKNKKKEVLYG